MEKIRTLTNEHELLQSKFEDLYSRHDALSADHDDLRLENDNFLARQICASQEEFVPPY